MPLLPIVTYPDARLREVAQPIETIDDSIRILAADMAETMYDAIGVGLAATQVGVAKRLAVIDCDPGGEESNLLTLINPEILESEGELFEEEGCLSVPGYQARVNRSSWIKARWTDLDGQQHEVETEGLFAVALQHEIDHLDGKLFVDYLSPMKRNMFRKKYQKMQKQQEESA